MKGRLLLALLVCLPAAAPAAESGSGALLLRAGGVGFAEGGADAVLVEDGVIVAVGRYADGYVGGSAVPPGARIAHVPGGRVLPGFIDAGTLLAGSRPAGHAVTADVHAADGFDPFGDYDRILAAGVTTVALDPGRGRLVPGVSAVARLAGGDAEGRILCREGALHVVLTAAGRRPPYVYAPPANPNSETNPLEPAKRQLPTTLAGAALRLRELFRFAAGEESPDPEEIEPFGLPVLGRALRGELPVVFHADREDEIRLALELAAEYRAAGLRPVLAGGEEAGELADQVAAAGLPVILDTGSTPGAMPAGEDPETVLRRERSLGAAAALRRAGATVAFRSSGDPSDLPFLASRFLRPGFSRRDLLRALTADAAEILGIADRQGAVAAGMAADLVVLDADGGVAVVVAGGEVVHETEARSDLLVVRGRRILADEDRTVLDGGVLVSGGRILEVGPVARPAGARVVEGPVVVPGFIDAHGYLGLLDPAARGSVPPQLPLSVPTARGLAPGSPAFVPVARAGVTTYVAAPPGRGFVAGLASVAHTAGRTRDDLILADTGAVVLTVAGSRDLASTAEQLTGLLTGAKGYADGWAAYGKAREEYDAWIAAGKPGKEKKPPGSPGKDANREPFRAAFEGRIPLMVRARTGPEVRLVLDVATGKFGLPVLLVGAEDAVALAPEMAKAGAAVVLGPRLIVPGEAGPANLAAAYSRAGVPVLFGSSGTTGAASLPSTVAHAVDRGLGAGRALAGLTWEAADRLGIADRTGRIAPGLTADLLVLSGPPFWAGTRVLAVVRGGEVVYEEKEETR